MAQDGLFLWLATAFCVYVTCEKMTAHLRQTHVFPVIEKGGHAFGMKGCEMQYCANDYYCNFYFKEENGDEICIYGTPSNMTIDQNYIGYIKDRNGTGTADQCGLQEEDDLTIEETLAMYKGPCDGCRNFVASNYSAASFKIVDQSLPMVREVATIGQLGMTWTIDYSATEDDTFACYFQFHSVNGAEMTCKLDKTTINVDAVYTEVLYCQDGIYLDTAYGRMGFKYTNASVCIRHECY